MNVTFPKITVFGEVLVDRFPDGTEIFGGAPFNVAWHLEAFGLNPLFLSRIGQDAAGEQIIRSMQGWGLDTSGLQRDDLYPTGAVDIRFEEGQPYYTILSEQAYDYMEALPSEIHRTDWLYHGSLALRHPNTRSVFLSCLEHYQGQVFVDINLRFPWWDNTWLEFLLEHADWLKLNHEELLYLSRSGTTYQDQAMTLFTDFPKLSGIILTFGEEGAWVLNPSGEKWIVVPEAGQVVVDTVGAGDSFVAVFLMGLMQGWSMETILKRAQQFASGIVAKKGATVTDLGFYQAMLSLWQPI